ncbi:NAD(P)-binding protein [archaeon]|jgi:uncharacterized protein|nr:NAD(P)-binding protein [archaeon]MBT6824415.1 NAD(P)-binding protein [archaeon]MBT7107306.1 NAD(P)-binding protein [archaeon]MBT7297391.1 NAD(P)-binding protein [archaeon]
MTYDVIIVGAGPAGLFAAKILSKKKLKTLIIDERSIPGGAGALTDGKLIFDNRIGMELDELSIDEEKANSIIHYIENYFLKLGVPPEVSGIDAVRGEKIRKRAAKYGLNFILSKSRHMGTDNAHKIMKKFKEELGLRGVDFLMNTRVEKVNNEKKGFVVSTNHKKKFDSKYLLVCPGRGGSHWWRKQADKLGIKYKHGPIQMGVRVELPVETLKPITDVSYDAKFLFKSLSHNDGVRTFCVCPGGFVTLEPPQNGIPYRGKMLQPVNGHALSKMKSKNTNFAILVTLPLTKPESDPKEYIIRSVINTYENGGGKPIAQRWGDLIRGSRSKKETFDSVARGYDRVKSTMNTEFTPGDISIAYPERFYSAIKEMIIQLDKIIPGVAHPSTILYIPEVKLCDTVYLTLKDTNETSVNNLFVAGDGAGKSRGIVGAGVAGILAAEGIIKKELND